MLYTNFAKFFVSLSFFNDVLEKQRYCKIRKVQRVFLHQVNGSVDSGIENLATVENFKEIIQ